MIRRLILTVLLLFSFALPVQGQSRYPLSGLFYANGPGAGIDAAGSVNGTPGLVGRLPYSNLPAVVISATEDGLLTVQLTDGSVVTVQLNIGSGGGLTTSQAQSVVGGMVTGNVETGGITLVYNAGTQKIDATITSIGTAQIADDAITEAKLAQAVRDRLGDDHFKDAWNASDTYVLGDVVVHNNSFWIARGGVAANDPPTVGHAIWIALASPQSVLDRRSTGLTVPAADGSNDVSLAVTNTGLYYVEVTPHAATPAQATWTTFTRTGYLGAQRSDQVRDPQAANENYYDTTHHYWQSAYLRNPLLGDYRWATSQAPLGWAGHYHSRALVLVSRDWNVGDQLIAFTGVSVERATITASATGAYTTRTWKRADLSDIGVWEALVRVLTSVATDAEIRSFKALLQPSILDDTDTPTDFLSNRYWRTNAAGTAVDQVPEPVQQPTIIPVGSVPATNIGNVIYLTHDHYAGGRSDLTVTTGSFTDPFGGTTFGYDRGNRDHQPFGSTNRDAGPLEAVTGEGAAGNSFVWSFNRHWLDSFTDVVIDGTEYALTASQALGGAFYRQPGTQQPVPSTTTFTLNFKRADDTYAYTQLTTLVNRAGIYQWDPDTNRYDEGLFGPFPTITLNLTVRAGSIYRIGSVIYTPTSDFTVDADRLPPNGSAVGTSWQLLTQTAANVPVDTAGFVKNLSSDDNTVQKVADQVDGLEQVPAQTIRLQYSIAEGETALATEMSLNEGNLLAIQRATTIRSGKMWVRPGETATYSAVIVRASRVSDTDYRQVVGSGVQLELNGTSSTLIVTDTTTPTEIDLTFPSDAADYVVEAGEYLAIYLNVVSGGGGRADVLQGETTLSQNAFVGFTGADAIIGTPPLAYVAKLSNNDGLQGNFFRTDERYVRMIVNYDTVVRQPLVVENGNGRVIYAGLDRLRITGAIVSGDRVTLPSEGGGGGATLHTATGDHGSNALQTQEHTFPAADNQIGTVTFTPGATDSRIALSVSFDVRTDTSQAVDDVGVRYALYRGTTRLGDIHETYLDVSDGTIQNWKQSLSFSHVETLTSTDEVTYALHAQRLLPSGGASHPVHLEEWTITAVDYSGTAGSGGGSGGGVGTDDQTAAEVPTDTSGFGVNLTTGANTVQRALDEIDNLSLGGAVALDERIWDTGTPLYSASPVVAPRGITLHGDDVLVVNESPDRFYRRSNGVWDAGTPLPAALTMPEGIATHGDDVLVVDQGSLRYYRYSNGTWDAGIALPAAAVNPSGIAVHGNDVLVVNAVPARYYRYSNGSWDGGTALPTAVVLPEGITVDGDDVLVLDEDTDLYYRYSNGAWDAGIALPTVLTSETWGITTDGASVYVVNAGTDRYYRDRPAVTGSNTRISTANFNRNLRPTDNTAQLAFDRLDDLVAAGEDATARAAAATAQTAAEAAQTTADAATTPTEARALIADWAEEGNTDRPPDDKEPVLASQDEAEAGTVTDLRSWTPMRIRQAVEALAPSGSGTGLATVSTQAPVSGDGTAANPVTVADNAITEQKLAADLRSRLGTAAFVYVQALPAAGSVPVDNYSKIYVVRASDTAAPTILAHLKPTDATVGEWSTGRDPSNYNRIGYTLDSYGELVPALNITGLYETPVGPTHHRLVLNVAASGLIPRANTGRSVYFRQYDTSDQWRAISVEGGASGSYTSSDYTSQFVSPGRRYEVVVRSQGAGLSSQQLVTAPPTTERYDFYTNGVKWAILPDADELLHSNVMIEVLQGNILLPRPTADETGYVPSANAELTFDLVDPATLGAGTEDATARAAAAAAQTAAEAAQTTADAAITTAEARGLIADWAEFGNTLRPPDDKEPFIVSQPIAEAGTDTDIYSWTAERIAQAIAALAPAGTGGLTVSDADNGRLLVVEGGAVVARTPTMIGPEWARSPILPTSPQSSRVDDTVERVILFNSNTAWSVTTTGTTVGVTAPVASPVPSQNQNVLQMPALLPSTVMTGLWAIPYVGATPVMHRRCFLPWSGGFFHQIRVVASTVCYVKFDDDSEAGVILNSNTDTERLSIRITEADSDVQNWPVNSTIRIHPAGIFWE